MADQDFSEIARLSERYNKDPKSKIFVQLADAYRKNNMVDEALEVLKQGLQYHPQYPLAYLILGKCYFDKREYQQSKEALEKTVQLDPMNIVALRLLAQVCGNLKDEDGLISAYRGIVLVDPADAMAKEKLASLEAKQKKEPVYTITLAEEYERQGNIDEALKVYEHLSFMDPSDVVIKERIIKLKEKIRGEEVSEEKKIEGLKLESYFQPEELGRVPEIIPETPITPPPLETVQELTVEPPKIEPPPVEPAFEITEPPKEEILSVQDFLLEPVEEEPVTEAKKEGLLFEEKPAEPIKETPAPAAEIETELPKEQMIEVESVVEEAISSLPEEKVEEIQVKTEEFLQPVEIEETKPEEISKLEMPPEMEKETPPPQPEVEEKLEPEKEPKKEEVQKPKEEDFKSFQDWLSSLLK